MGLSMDPILVLKLLLEKKFKKKERAADYLDAIAKEARSLADAWSIVVNELLSGNKEVDVDQNARLRDEVEKYHPPNTPYYYRLRSFYQYFTSATEGKLNQEWRETIVDSLGGLLYDREITLDNYRRVKRRMRSSVFFDEDNSIEDFRDLSRSVVALQKEAAALEVIAKTIRATIT